MTVSLTEILSDVLGDVPNDRNLWLATKHGHSSTDLALKFVERYQEAELMPLPKKDADTLRPAFLVDYSGRELTPYDREFSFIARSLSYADQVAVVDDIGSWAQADDPERVIEYKARGAFPESDDVLWALRRIALYSSLEEAGLLHYIEKPIQADREGVHELVTESVVDELFLLVTRRMGYSRGGPDSPMSREIVAADLGMWFEQFYTVMSQIDILNQHVDLYLPDWFAGPELLEWTYRNTLPPNWVSTESLRSNRVVNQLLTLPAPSSEIIQRLSVDELLRIRATDQLSSWREDFATQLQVLDAEPSLLGYQQFRDGLTDRAERLLDQRSHPAFGSVMTEAIQTGLTVAPVAAVAGQDVVGTVAVGTAPILGQLAGLFGSWLRGGALGTDEGYVRDIPAETTALRLYLNEPVAGARPTSQRPPTSYMRTLDGQPLAFDPFDDWVVERYGRQ